jgi:hypothetical protein
VSAEGSAGGQRDSYLIAHTVRLGVKEHLGEEGISQRIGLQAVRAPRQAIKGYQGEGLITDSVYYLPLLDADGNIQVVHAHGVDEITTVTRTRLPHAAREIFPAIRAYMPWMETGAGRVELLIDLDKRQWLPAHVEDLWDPDCAAEAIFCCPTENSHHLKS